MHKYTTSRPTDSCPRPLPHPATPSGAARPSQALQEADAEVARELLAATQAEVEAYQQRVRERRDAVERAGVAASGARQRLQASEAALQAAQQAVKDADLAVVEGARRADQAEREVQRLQAASGALRRRAGLAAGWAQLGLQRVGRGRTRGLGLH